MGITMPDGCRLSARTWMPDDASNNPVPAILEFLPYRKRDGTTARDSLTHPYFAKRGYACIRVDMRGNGDSQGLMDDEYTLQELDDAVATIKWLAKQPWCSGNVGMMGISWGGFNALQVAALQPSALKAIITLCSTVDRYADDIHYKGGCLLNENLGWGSTMWAYSSRAPDPALVGTEWREMWIDRLKAEPFLPYIWLNHQNRDAYWKHGSVCEDYTAIKAAVLAIGGWGDAYKNTVSNLLENISAPVKGIVGPWMHKYPHFAAPEPRIGFLQEALRWWDHWLKDFDRGVEDDPDYTAYLMDGVRPQTRYEHRYGHWIAENNWPHGLKIQSWHLQNDQMLGTEPAQMRTMINSPHTCGLSGGEYCAIWLGADMPGDQRADDALSACFTSAELDQDCDIVGAPKLALRLQADKPAAQIAVRLNHIHPDGASTRITYGVLNLAHRDGFDTAKPLVPHDMIDVTIPFDHIAYRVPKGHRIRIAVSTSYWPLLWPSPESATIQLDAGTLDLPTRQSGSKNERDFAEPEAETPWNTEVVRQASNSRKQTTDLATGLVTLEIIDDFGSVKDNDHGLINGSVAREWWHIHPDDPLSASAQTHWTTYNARDDWSVRTETYASMRSDAGQFYLTARLEAYEGDALIYEKDLEHSVQRDYR
jgi:putative CocE/NonD family hydrolase